MYNVSFATSISPTFNAPRPSLTHTSVHQGLTLVHFSAQLEPCLTRKHALITLSTAEHPQNTGSTTPTRSPCPIESAQVELKSE